MLIILEKNAAVAQGLLSQQISWRRVSEGCLPFVRESKTSGAGCSFAGVGWHRQRTCPPPQLPTCGHAV